VCKDFLPCNVRAQSKILGCVAGAALSLLSSLLLEGVRWWRRCFVQLERGFLLDGNGFGKSSVYWRRGGQNATQNTAQPHRPNGHDVDRLGHRGNLQSKVLPNIASEGHANVRRGFRLETRQCRTHLIRA